MHELSIAMSILEIAGEEAERRGNAQVEAIHLKIGPAVRHCQGGARIGLSACVRTNAIPRLPPDYRGCSDRCLLSEVQSGTSGPVRSMVLLRGMRHSCDRSDKRARVASLCPGAIE